MYKARIHVAPGSRCRHVKDIAPCRVATAVRRMTSAVQGRADNFRGVQRTKRRDQCRACSLKVNATQPIGATAGSTHSTVMRQASKAAHVNFVPKSVVNGDDYNRGPILSRLLACRCVPGALVLPSSPHTMLLLLHVRRTSCCRALRCRRDAWRHWQAPPSFRAWRP